MLSPQLSALLRITWADQWERSEVGGRERGGRGEISERRGARWRREREVAEERSVRGGERGGGERGGTGEISEREEREEEGRGGEKERSARERRDWKSVV